MAYFIRRRGDDCSVIALHPDDREEIIASGLAIGAAEDLCVSKIEAMSSAAAPLPVKLDDRSRPGHALGSAVKFMGCVFVRHMAQCGMARVRVSIVFESGARIGPGKAKLLESIRDTGSISAAARGMGMSYKRAWMLLDSINRAFTEPVVRAAPGGAGGGGASLTPFGAELLERYHRILDRAATNAVDDLAALARRACPDAGPKV